MSEALQTRSNQTHEEAAGLFKRAQSGDEAVLPELRRLFDESPELWSRLGDLALQAELSWIGLASGGNAFIGEALTRHIAGFRRELAGPAPSIMERLLVDRIITCWLQVHYADQMCACADVAPGRVEFFQRRLDRAQRRYLSAIRSLATLRRLALPTPVQVNIGGQHVNVLAAAAGQTEG